MKVVSFCSSVLVLGDRCVVAVRAQLADRRYLAADGSLRRVAPARLLVEIGAVRSSD